MAATIFRLSDAFDPYQSQNPRIRGIASIKQGMELLGRGSLADGVKNVFLAGVAVGAVAGVVACIVVGSGAKAAAGFAEKRRQRKAAQQKDEQKAE